MAAADLEPALRRGVAWLIAAQAADGGWHSGVYGALRGGAAVTGLTLEALSRLPDGLRETVAGSAREAAAFLSPGVDRRGAAACPDGTLDYPVYATALVLAAARRLPLDALAERRPRLARYLLDAQLLDAQGFRPESPHYGGWDLAGAAPGPRPSTGSNVSYVRYALEGLAAVDSDALAPPRLATARAAALQWLDRCQRPTGDGGFDFAPEPASLDNKAGWADAQRRRPRAYATCSCDGLRALTAAGVGADDPRRQAVARWLADRPELERIPGLADDEQGRAWSAGLQYYYAATLARALPLFASPPDREARQAALAAGLVERQRGDGAWRNDSARMREDDPLIATALAVGALADCLGGQGSSER